METGVKLAPVYWFLKDGVKVHEYVGADYFQLEVSFCGVRFF